jgi:DNA polymerase-1|tara:strand:- start:4154 stop:6874 length:2721 start_codon:yes stop_codon:yes gene_type:complete
MNVKQKEDFLVLLDGTAYLYRAYHALPPLKNSKGDNTGAIHGFLKALNKILDDYKPKYIGLIFDAKGKNFRHEIYDQYKANRSSMPPELIEQIPVLYEILESQGYPPIIIDGVEADDVIGTLSKKFKTIKEVKIFSGDKDFAQLVDKKISIINPITLDVMDQKGVKKKFDVGPKNIIDYLALMGDKSDNIPGVPGVGGKTASRLINKFGNVEEIIEKKELVPGKVGESLKSNIDQLKLSKILATIKTDVDIKLNLLDLEKKDSNDNKLIDIYKRLELNSFLKNESKEKYLEKNKEVNVEKKISNKFDIIHDKKKFISILKDIKEKNFLSFDLETTSLDYMMAEVVGISFALNTKKSFYVPIGHEADKKYNQLSLSFVMDNFKPILESHQIKKLGHNLKYDRNVLRNYDIVLNGIEHDSMLLSYIYDPTAIRHGLDNVAEKYLSYKTIHYEDVAGKGAKQIPFSKVNIDIAAEYACEDALVSYELYYYFWKKLQEDKNVVKVYQDIEMQLMPVLSDIERNGVLVDSKKLEKLSSELESELKKIQKKCYEITGKEFNLNSPKQLQEILYIDLKIPINGIKKTASGNPSTDEDTLQYLSQAHELPKLILDFRSLNKLKTGYTDKLPLQISKKTGRIHTSYQQAITATGRLSSTEPNLQNIPIKSQQGKKIREAFIAEPKKKIFAADYSQIELRIMAHLSKDKNLLKAFKDKTDIHSFTAAEIFNIDIDKVTDENRRAAKAINFGLIYGMSSFGLSKQLGIPIPEAKNYMDIYFERYPKIKLFMSKTIDFANKNGYVETIYGRKLYLPEINSKQPQRRKYAERTAINAPVQGTAADIIKIAMIEINKWLYEKKSKTKMIMQVHDELVFEIHDDDVSHEVSHIVNIMQDCVKLDLPLEVNYGIDKNWGDAH